MIERWQEFLIDAGAEFGNGCVEHFGSPRREASLVITGDVFADLSWQGLISVKGADAASFLHAQFTNDILNLGTGESRFTGYCNPKGRLLALMRVFRRDQAFYLSLPEDLVESILGRLRKFVMRADVVLDSVSQEFVRLGVSGQDMEACLATVLPRLPGKIGEVIDHDKTLVIRVPGVHLCFELYTAVDGAASLWDALNVRGAPVGRDAWRLISILSGVPSIHPQTEEAFVPQMVNLHLLDGVDFKKGCYPGQEIVARMHYLGKLKRRMYLARVDSSDAPSPGDRVFSEKNADQAVGDLVSAARHPDGGYAVLAVIQIEDAETPGKPLCLNAPGGPALKIKELPYPVPTSSAI